MPFTPTKRKVGNTDILDSSKIHSLSRYVHLDDRTMSRAWRWQYSHFIDRDEVSASVVPTNQPTAIAYVENFPC
jgi:hypothetical protein